MDSRSLPSLVADWPPPEVAACPCGRSHRIATRNVHLGAGVLDGIERWMPRHHAGPFLVVSDPDTRDAAGERVIRNLRAGGIAVREFVLEREPHADDRTLERLLPSLACAPSRVVAVGSGTIGDLGKALAAEAEVPLATVGTAASMNGYASSIVALTVGGLKVTRSAPPPDVLVLDTDVLAAAPVRLTRAGLGDLCSKPVSGADWILSEFVYGERICSAALTLADGAVARARGCAARIGRGDAAAVAVLAEALVVSGLSMSAAGVSSPASGGEHLLSHYLDISAEGWSRRPRLHGEQVAVGTRVSLALYHRLREAGPPGGPLPPDESEEDRAALHRHLGPQVLASVLAEAGTKAERAPRRPERAGMLAAGWSALWTRLDRQLGSAAGLDEDLAAAGVPSTFEAIDVDRERAGTLIRIARHMRARYTVLDVAADLGHLGRWSEEIAAELGGAK